MNCFYLVFDLHNNPLRSVKKKKWTSHMKKLKPEFGSLPKMKLLRLQCGEWT